jgi:MerR family transcriptional regulator, thiopeptide resistance regulator
MAVYTVGRLAKKFQLSRSTLLYYDSLGLLKPSSRTDKDYRLYSEEDAKRLEQICLYRQAGLPLSDIGRVLDSPENSLVNVLEKRLDELGEDIKHLREQQLFIITLLKNDRLLERIDVMNKETWISLLAASGFTPEDMRQWHSEFERLSPEKHLKFLSFLCIPEDEIQIIRSWASRVGR